MKRSVNHFKLIAMSLAIVFLFTQCNNNPDPVSPISARLTEVLNIAQSNSINRNNIDWADLRVQLEERERQSGFESAIRLLLRTLGDNHSFYIYDGGRRISESELSCAGDAFGFASLPSDIGYIKVEAFSGSVTAARALAANIQQSIREQDVDGLKGWVVDLSNNLGGNMYPMIAGLGPFYQQEVLGYFIDPNGLDTEWGYAEGASFVNDRAIQVTVVDAPYQLANPDLKVAVIVSNRTASSGEATLISFMGRENTLVLGQPSCGLSTANSSFELNNGGVLVLTVSTMADRNGQLFGGQVVPDELIDNNQDMVNRVVEWINE